MVITGRPIVKKNNRRLVKSGNRTYFIPSKAFKRFQKDALTELLQYKEQYTGPVHITITFEMKGKLDTDLDNMISSILDILEEGEVLDNDKNVASLSAAKFHGFKDWKTIINIKSVDPANGKSKIHST